jgi:hypothetical protein
MPTGTWRGAYSATTTYKTGDTVVPAGGGSGSPIYIGAIDNNLNHPLGTNRYWQQAPNVTWDGSSKKYYDKITVAFYAARAYILGNSTGTTVRFGPGYWPTQLKLEQLNQSLYGVSISGDGVTTSYIVDNTGDKLHATLSSPGVASGTFVTFNLNNFTVISDYQASSCGQFWGVNQPMWTNINCVSPADGADAYWVLGDAKDFGHHGFYGGTLTNVFVSGPSKPSTTALITAKLVSGSVDPASITIPNHGAGYCNTTHCYTWINFYVPGGCAIQPTGKPTITNGTIASVAMTNNGSKCVGTELDVQTATVAPIRVGVDARGASDTRFFNLTTQGPLWGVDLSVGGNNVLHGAHLTYGPFGVNIASNNVAQASELDQIQSQGFYIKGSNGVRISDTHAFSPAVGPGAAAYVFDSTASNVTIGGDAQLLSHNNTSHKWGALANGGVIDTNLALLPSHTNVIGSPPTGSGGLGTTVIQDFAYLGNLNVSRFGIANCSATGGLNGGSAAGTFGYTPAGGIRGCVNVSGTHGWEPITQTNEVVAFSPTPAFSNATSSSSITMTASITTFTLPSGVDGQGKTLTFCQDRIGSWRLNGPGNVHGLFNIGGKANRCNSQHFNYSVTQNVWLADSRGVTDE